LITLKTAKKIAIQNAEIAINFYQVTHNRIYLRPVKPDDKLVVWTVSAKAQQSRGIEPIIGKYVDEYNLALDNFQRNLLDN